ncbi:MAG: hypothetical protein U0744_11120 [Gemmataceae bacterium]
MKEAEAAKSNGRRVDARAGSGRVVANARRFADGSVRILVHPVKLNNCSPPSKRIALGVSPAAEKDA